MNSILKLSILISIFEFLSCENDNNFHMLDLNDLKSTWDFEKFIDKKNNQSDFIPEDFYAEITIHGDKCIQVQGPCNIGPGNFRINGNIIEITHLAMTEMVCTGYEDVFTNNLSGKYLIDGNKLTIISINDYDIVFNRMDSTKLYDCYDF